MDRARAQSFLRDANVQVVRENPRPSVSSASSSNSQNSRLAREIEMELGMTPRTSGSLTSGNIHNIVADVASPSPVSRNLKVSNLKVGMFNITINKSLRSDMKRVDILAPLTRPIRGAATIGNGLKLEVREISAIYGRFQKGITVNKNGWRGPSEQEWFDNPNKFSNTYFAVELKINVSKGSVKKGVSFTIYSNGKVRFSGGFVSDTDFQQEPELIRKYIIDTYTNQEALLYKPLEFNNLSAQFKVNGKLNLAKIAQSFAKYSSYEPELSPQLYYTHPNGYKYVMTSTGFVQIQGADTMDKLMSAYTNGSELMQSIYARGGVTDLVRNVGNAVKQKKNAVKNKSTCPKPRQPKNGKCAKATNSIRKNPQGFDCCYKKAKKAAQARKSPTVRLVLDPKYGLKIGTRQCMRYSRDALRDIARKQGVVGLTNRTSKDTICAKLVNTMGITQYAPFTHNGKEYVMTGNNKNFRIGSRVCTTYPMATLRAFAKKMGIPVVAKDKRSDICKKIQNFRIRLPSPKNSPPPAAKKTRGRPKKKTPPPRRATVTPTTSRLRN